MEENSLSPKWVIDETGSLRRATIHHMGRRLPGWDYCRPAIYFITIVVEDRSRQPLGRILVSDRASGVWVPLAEARGLAREPDEVEAKVEFSELGRAVLAHFRRISHFTPEIDPLYCEVMPDHLHFALQVKRALKRPIGQTIAGFKTGCEKIAASMGYAGRLWAEGFVDEIVMRQGQLAAEFNYLHDNPRRRAIKALFPDLFRVVSNLRVTLRHTPQGQDGQHPASGASLTGEFCPAGLPRTTRAVCLAPEAQAVGWFSALGNRFLLDRPLVQVQVSRSHFRYRRVTTARGGLKIARDEKGEPIIELTTREFEAKKARLLAVARRGIALISPCVSDGERQIARVALAQGARLVTLQNKGFAPLQKPGGRYFDACAKGRLLMLAPAAWPHQVDEKPMTRFDAAAMNRLCQWLAGSGAAEINYHGMKPQNIDELALAAVKAKP